MNSAISHITVLPQTKSEIDAFAVRIKAEILSGYHNPLDFKLRLKAFEELLKKLSADPEIKAAIELETDKYTEKTIEINGNKITKQERKTFDFSACGSARWEEAAMREQQAKCDREGVEAWLKGLKNETPDVITGEAVMPPAYTTNSILSITLAK